MSTLAPRSSSQLPRYISSKEHKDRFWEKALMRAGDREDIHRSSQAGVEGASRGTAPFGTWDLRTKSEVREHLKL